jgi:glycosyltransferase involved in cell wall biosynthesis
MKITIVMGPFLPVPPVLGGAVEKVQLQLAEAYAAAGHGVTMISRQFGDFPDKEKRAGVRHIRVKSFDRSSALQINLILDFVYALRAARVVPPSDVTITNSFSLPLALCRDRAGRIYVHVARFPKHQMFLYSRADRLQAISHAVADEIVRQVPSLASKVKSIGYPVPDLYFGSTSEKERRKTILYVGRIAREKGVHLLIDAFAALVKRIGAEVAGWKLKIVGPHEVKQGGDGAGYYTELTRRAEPLGAMCEFAGPIFDERQLANEYRSAFVFVYPSLAEKGEAFGLAPLEAMASGCAVIVSDLRCFDDFVQNGKNGLKFDHRGPDPVSGLAEQLAVLLARPDRLGAIAAEGCATAQSFRIPAIAAKMLDDFRSLGIR